MSDLPGQDRQETRGIDPPARPTPNRPTAGFTLVEILVAFAITGLLSVAIYALFSTTSSSLREADSLAGTLEGTRFTLERMRTELQNAAALGTPDMYWDECDGGPPPCVAPDPEGPHVPNEQKRRVVGLASYNGWQDYASSIMSTGSIDQHKINTDHGKSPEFDGIVVIGAIDFPIPFEIGLTPGSVGRVPTVFPDERGLYKLLRNNLFDTALGPPTSASMSSVTDQVDHRILRVMDMTGAQQYVGISGFSGNDIDQPLNLTPSHTFYEKTEGDTDFGLDPRTQQDDKRYPAAMLDVYWYHVINAGGTGLDGDPLNGETDNFLLVRDRLDGTTVMNALASSDWKGFDPSGLQGSRVVLADRVVDFQIWFDCANSEGEVTGASWNTGWQPPTGDSDDLHNCLDPETPRPGEARLMHVRMSRRTQTERAEMPSVAFPQGSEHMQAFDLDPEMKGATRVYTSQIDFELPTFAARNVISPEAPAPSK